MSLPSPTPAEAAGKTREAWAGNSPLRRAARERLLDAASRCIARDGLVATGIASVATEAGVSRPTVYRYFADRHALVLATLLREGRHLAARIALHLRAFGDAATMAVEAELFVLSQVPHQPLLAEIWNSTVLDASMLAEFTRPETIAIARDALAGLEKEAGWSEAQAIEASELALRFALTLLIAPSPQRNEAELRAFLWKRLIPALGLTRS